MDLAPTLSRLKQSGATLLVTGDVPTDIHARVGRSLMGTEATPRRRVIVLQGQDPTAATQRLPEGARTGEDHLYVIPDGQTTRSGADPAAPSVDASTGDPGAPGASADGDHRASVPTLEPADDSLREVGAAMAEAVDALERSAGGFDPAELRVGVDALSSLVRADDPRDACTFLNLFSHMVTDRQGMGHVHLPVDPTDPVLDRYGPLFDVIVEVRLEGGRARQRWSVLDGPTSEWLPV